MSALPHPPRRVEDLRRSLAGLTGRFSRPILTVSFGAEDMVLLDLVAREFRSVRIATLDTGRLPVETYQLWQDACQRYRVKIDAVFPQAEAVEQYVRVHGINAFYDSLAERKLCCEIRKVEPLKRLLAGHDAWITGLRRAQSEARSALALEEFDAQHALTKCNPLAEWSEAEVWDYLAENDVPVHALHAQGYPSIGCAPCTRAVAPGEALRAGRWWWENDSQKECGLHVAKENAQ